MEKTDQNAPLTAERSSIAKYIVLTLVLSLLIGSIAGFILGKATSNNSTTIASQSQNNASQISATPILPSSTNADSSQNFYLKVYDVSIQLPQGWTVGQMDNSIDCALVKTDNPTFYKAGCPANNEIDGSIYTFTSPQGTSNFQIIGSDGGEGFGCATDSFKNYSVQIKGASYNLNMCAPNSDGTYDSINRVNMTGSKSNWSTALLQIRAADESNVKSILNILSTIK